MKRNSQIYYCGHASRDLLLNSDSLQGACKNLNTVPVLRNEKANHVTKALVKLHYYKYNKTGKKGVFGAKSSKLQTQCLEKRYVKIAEPFQSRFQLHLINPLDPSLLLPLWFLYHKRKYNTLTKALAYMKCKVSIESDITDLPISSRLSAYILDTYLLFLLLCVKACLKRVGSSDANLVGKLFFNFVQTKCFVLKPKKKCVRTSWWGTCEKHKVVKQAILRDNSAY
nr:unnamed protein product [Callosobruchus chinensis]